MAENSIPREGRRWYERNGAQIDVSWQLLPAGLGVRKWLFTWEGAVVRKYSGFHCFWLRGWVRILGISAGAGIFLQGRKIDD